MGEGSRLLCIHQRGRCRESSSLVQSDDRSRMNLPISLRLGSVYIKLEDRKKPWSISDGVSLYREREALMKVVAEDPDHLEARLRLANLLEEDGQKAEALEIVTDGMPTL